MKLNAAVKGVGTVLCLSLLTLSCRDVVPEANQTPASLTGGARLAATDDHPGKLLAANCFQCHGTNGTGMEHLAGKPASKIVNEMLEMQAENPRADIMNVHAKAYTTEEIKLIADFFSKQ